MQDEAPVISNDVAILGQVILERDVSHKAIASKLNVHISTVYDYLSGKRTAPISIYRVVNRMTHDPRIPKLLNGDDEPTMMTLVVITDGDKPAEVPDVPELLPAAIEATKAQLASLETLQKIVADGKVDQADAKWIAELKATLLKAQDLCARVSAGVFAAFKKAKKEAK